MVDEEGFLRDSELWDENVAKSIAQKEGVDCLDEAKLQIIKALREHYKQFQSFPILAKICRRAGNRRRDCIDQEFHNPMVAWKIAGLPKPSNIFFTSFDGRHYIANPFY